MIAVRPIAKADADEHAFVAARWRRSMNGTQDVHEWVFRGERKAHHTVPSQHMSAEVDRIMAALLPQGVGSEIRARASVVVACDAADEGTLVGFACASALPIGGHELHWIYVHESLRRHGVATQMLGTLDVRAFTFWSPMLEYLRPADRGWKFTPRWTMH